MAGEVKAIKSVLLINNRKFIKLDINTFSFFSLNQATKGVQIATLFHIIVISSKTNCLFQTESHFKLTVIASKALFFLL